MIAALVVLLSVLCAWPLRLMLFPIDHYPAPAIVADVPYDGQDWRGLI